MAYRHKTYICFDGDKDIHYYRLMCAWKENDGIEFSFYNAHDLNTARDNSQEASIKRQLKERLNLSEVLVVLVGETTRYLYRFVRWEMEQAIAMDLPVICVNLNGVRNIDVDRCPPLLRNELAMHISFNAAIVQFALENWPNQHRGCRTKNDSGPYYYNGDIYKRLEL